MVKGTQTHTFRNILLATGWADNVTLAIDDAGVITKISEAVTKGMGGIAIPAMTNAHSHAFQRAFVGKTEAMGAEGDDFWAWRKIMYEALTAIGPEELEAIAAWLYVEMLKSGYSGVGEFHYLHHQADGTPYDDRAIMAEAIYKAAQASGIDLTLLPVLYMRNDFGEETIGPGQAPFGNGPEDFQALVTAISKKMKTGRLGVAIHSLRAVHEDLVKEIAGAFKDGPIHIHVSEQTTEVDKCVEVHGKRPIEWLLDNVEMDERWNLIHATHVTETEWHGIIKAGATIVLCPTTEANLGDGIFPFADYYSGGGMFAIGSDSHVSIDPREELRLLEYSQRLALQKRGVSADESHPNPGFNLWAGAAAGGAKAIGQQGPGLSVDAPANIAILDGNHPAIAGREGDEVLNALVFAGQPTPVKDLMVNGVWQVQDYHHQNEDAIRARFLSVIKRL